MGQKVNPIGIRLGIIKEWNSKWFAGKRYAEFLIQDIKLRNELKKKLMAAAVSKILIERPANNAVVTILTARPRVIIGKKGGGIETLRKEISTKLGVPVHLNIEEIKRQSRHSDIDTLLGYIQLSDEEVKDAYLRGISLDEDKPKPTKQLNTSNNQQDTVNNLELKLIEKLANGEITSEAYGHAILKLKEAKNKDNKGYH